MEKKRVITHYNNLTPELQEALREKYPDGYMNHIFKVTKPNGDFFYAVTLDTKKASYLVKVDVKIDNISENKLDDVIFAGIDSPKSGKLIDEEFDETDTDEDSGAGRKDDDKETDLF